MIRDLRARTFPKQTSILNNYVCFTFKDQVKFPRLVPRLQPIDQIQPATAPLQPNFPALQTRWHGMACRSSGTGMAWCRADPACGAGAQPIIWGQEQNPIYCRADPAHRARAGAIVVIWCTRMGPDPCAEPALCTGSGLGPTWEIWPTDRFQPVDQPCTAHLACRGEKMSSSALDNLAQFSQNHNNLMSLNVLPIWPPHMYSHVHAHARTHTHMRAHTLLFKIHQGILYGKMMFTQQEYPSLFLRIEHML